MGRTKLNISKCLPLLKLLVEVKKQKFKHMKLQGNYGQFIRSPPIVRKINRKITLFFHYLAHVGRNTSQLFCTSDIESTQEVIDIYEKYDKKFL